MTTQPDDYISLVNVRAYLDRALLDAEVRSGSNRIYDAVSRIDGSDTRLVAHYVDPQVSSLLKKPMALSRIH